MAAVMDWLGLRRRGEEHRSLTHDPGSESSYFAAPSVASPVFGERAALSLVDVFACVRLLAETASTLPLIAYRRDGDGRQRLAGGRLVELLREPAPGGTQSVLVGQLVQSLACRGNAFVGLYSDGEGRVVQLGVLDPARVQVRVVGGEPRYLLTHIDGRQTEHTTDDVIHMRLPVTLDGVMGASPLSVGCGALELNRALSEESSALALNGSAPRGVLTVPPGPTQGDLIENLRAAWQARHGGPKNAGRVAVLSGEVKFAAVSLSAHDAQLVEQMQLSTAAIARLFSIPPWMIGAKSGDSLTYSNVESQASAFLKFCLSAYLTCIEQALTNSPLCGALSYCEFLVDALLRPDSKTRADIYSLALGNASTGQPGWMTRDEVRARENLPPDPEPAQNVAQETA